MERQREEVRNSVAGASGADDLNEWDYATYRRLVSQELTEEQIDWIVQPENTYPQQKSVLAVHWHPEFVPMDLIRRRVDRMFPNRKNELIIPTQHNTIMELDGLAGAEVDCYSAGFNRKVQLLVHFDAKRLGDAEVFRSMLLHTFRYRSRQLFEFIDTILNEKLEGRLQRAVRDAAADTEIVDFVRTHTARLSRLLQEEEARTPPEAIRNKLLVNYIESLRMKFDPRFVGRAVSLLRAVKAVVKAHFSNDFFYRTEEIIEEVRGFGGGIIIPHPEQFWPVLLADYDVDGYEVWNPQSREYTEFLINVVSAQNKARPAAMNRLLILMGDDCHLGEKTRDPEIRDIEKSSREIGFQPAWDDLLIRKSLITARADRWSVIDEYRERLCS